MGSDPHHPPFSTNFDSLSLQNQKKSKQNQYQNLIVDIAVNGCLFNTVELKLLKPRSGSAFHKIP
jgi:hypothetical protein